MPRSLVLAALMIATVGCKKPDRAQPAATAAAAQPVAAQPPVARPPVAPIRARPLAATPTPLTILPTKIDLVASGISELTIGADGTVAFGGTPKLQLTADGRVTSLAGDELARIGDDGVVVMATAGADAEAIQIERDGTVTVDGEVVLRIDAGGAVHKRGRDGQLIDDGLAVFDGPPETRRAIALLLVGLTYGATAAPPPAPVTRAP